jgi:ribosomal protein S1
MPAARFSFGLSRPKRCARGHKNFATRSETGLVVSLTKFGAFVQIAEGVEGMIHVGDITAEKSHPAIARQSTPG